jgi:hypothetical protein
MARVLIGCEFSGAVRDAFLTRGHDAWSCDLVPAETGGPHLLGDVRDHIGAGWDLLIAFPPCTDLSTAGSRYWEAKRADGRQRAALELVRDLMTAPVPRIAVENPGGRISSAIRPPDQVIEPWQFGHPWKKRTCLWLENLPRLVATAVVEPAGHWVGGGSSAGRGALADDKLGNGWNEAGRAARRAARSRTFPGIAAAMAEQWGGGQGDGALFPAAPHRILDARQATW